jgi:hypothetical protein
MNDIIIEGIEETKVVIPNYAIQVRDNALQSALSILEVKTPDQQDMAVMCMKSLKTIMNDMENSRKQVKKPVLDMGKKIDSMAEEFIEEVNDHHNRISMLVTSFQEQERRKSELIRQEQERIRMEAIQKAEDAKKTLEAKMLAAKTDSAKAKVMDKILNVDEAAREQILESHKAQIEAAPAKSSGLVFKDDWKFEVTDINALFAAHPDCVKLEPENMMIRARIKQGMRECPGLRIYNEKKTFTRA